VSLRDRVVPYLRPIAHLLADEHITEIMLNSNGQRVFVEREGRLREVPGAQIDPRLLKVAIQNIARADGRDWSADEPVLDIRFDDGSRISAVAPPVAADGIVVTIRRFGQRHSLPQLVQAGMLSGILAEELRHALTVERTTILISGGTGVGKTTLLNAVASCIPSDERILILEDTPEIHIECNNLVRFTTSKQPAVGMGDLLRLSLRHRPDRLIVGEVRGAEAWDLLQCLNTGHSGSASTLHASSGEGALRRFAAMVQMSGHPIPFTTVCDLIAGTNCVVVHLSRLDGVRRVVEARRVLEYDHGRGWITAPVYSHAGERITPCAGQPAAMESLHAAKGGE